MLPLPREAAIEAMNVSTDRRHLFHTYYDDNLVRQFEFTQQNIVVNTHDVERNMDISNGTLTPLIQSVLLGDFNILMSKTELFLDYF